MAVLGEKWPHSSNMSKFQALGVADENVASVKVNLALFSQWDNKSTSFMNSDGWVEGNWNSLL